MKSLIATPLIAGLCTGCGSFGARNSTRSPENHWSEFDQHRFDGDLRGIRWPDSQDPGWDSYLDDYDDRRGRSRSE